MWANSYGMEYRYKNSPYANGANRIGNPHFDKDGKPVSEKAKKIAGQVNKVSNDTKQLSRNEAKAVYFSYK